MTFPAAGRGPAFIRGGRWFLAGLCLAVSARLAAAGLEPVTWMVDGISREALVHRPARTGAAGAPLVFVFHGHGGTMRQASQSMPVHEHWPEAIVVYPQGLPTPGRLTDPAGARSGWQAGPGDQGDRDLAFFDAMLAGLQRDQAVDGKRIYATGHSNGGAFTYLLWARRRPVFAAFGPSAAVVGRDFGPLAPAPVLHVAGEKDELVRFPWQRLMIQVLCRINGCGPGRPAGERLTVFESESGHPVMTYVHPGGHRYPAAATPLLVDFFQRHAQP